MPGREIDSFACRYGVLQGQVPVKAMLLLVAGAMVIKDATAKPRNDGARVAVE